MVQPRSLRLIGALAFALLTLALTFPETAPQGRAEAACPAGEVRIGDTVACAHEDVAPPGIDVHERPGVAELRNRPGASEAAYEAAEDLGVPSPVAANATASVPDVTCDGDGTSGYRVQAMYVVEAGRTNRYAALLSSFRLWAAGTDDVLNRSAALTGGVRHIRYVTDAVGGSCVANVLNVTVPAGSMASFGATVAAVQALGYTAPARKYLMWTDATVLCGVASMYTSDGPTQANPNNGSYPQYARVDAGCWGLGDGASQHSVEAHELMHTLGGVQNSAPHSTRVGHCYDESDTMCYADGGGIAMRQICPTSMEFFFDCNNDDYFSTFPQAGNYLETHWNAADSRFLIGGGNGAGGGAPGLPTVLGATIAVNNPAVPGLGTQASVTPQLPSGRTLTSVKWTSKRTDCTFDAPGELQTTVTCNAGSATSSSVTATLVDSTGATKVVTSPLTFVTGTARPVALSLTAASQSGTTASVCTSAVFPVQTRVVDVATGQPVKGLLVATSKQASTATSPSSAGSVLTTLDGYSTVKGIASLTTVYTAKTAATAVYAAGAPRTITAVPSRCAPTLTGTKDRANTYYADPVTVTGTLTRTVGAQQVPVAGAAVTVKILPTGATSSLSLGKVLTAADGSYRVVVKPTSSGSLRAELLGSTSYVATTVGLGSVSVQVPATLLTAAAIDVADGETLDAVGYGGTVVASGRLDRDAGGEITPVRASVTVLVTPPGKAAVKVAAGSTTTAGEYRISFPLRVSGEMAVSFAGSAGQPAKKVVLGNVVAGTWTTSLTAARSASSILLGQTTTVTGVASKTYGGVTVPAKGQRVLVYLTPTGSSVRSLLGSGTVASNGAYTVRTAPRVSGTLSVLLPAVAGHTEANAGPLSITVS